MTYGGREIGGSLEVASSVLGILAGGMSFGSTMSATIAGYQRRAQEWELQKNVSAGEMVQIDAQIAAATARVTQAQKDLDLTLAGIAQTNDMEALLLGKFTSKELYNWLAVRLSVVYFQTYKLAYDLALSAQRAYQFELDTANSYLNFGYWDSAKKGLMAGEGAVVGPKPA